MKKDVKQKQIESIMKKAFSNSQINYSTNQSKKQTNEIERKDEIEKTEYIRDMLKHLDILFEDFDSDVYIEIRSLDGKIREFFENTASNREKIARKYILSQDLCVSLNPRIAQAGTKEAVLEARFLLLDFDRKDDTKEINITYNDILNELAKFNLKPCFITFSGNGYHTYFKLDRVINAIDFEKLQHAFIEFVNKNISFENAKADEKIKDSTRIIRLASTINTKNNKITRIVYEDKEAITSYEYIKELLKNELKEEANIKEYTLDTRDLSSESLTSEELNELITRVKEKFIVGQRQYLILALAGVLAKKGFTEDEALRIYHEHFSSIDDSKDLKMREACIKRTYKLYRNNQEIASFSLLKEYDIDLSFLKSNHKENHKHDDVLSKLIIIDSETLAKMQFEKRIHVVENLIPSGLSILAGKSKLGKSWFSLFLSLHVATNTSLWGLFNVNNNDKYVYYFALEDYQERIQSRREKMIANLKLNSTNEKLRFVFNNRNYQFKFNDDGYKVLEELAKESCLIIIDTYVRAKEQKNYKNEYEYESQILSRLQAIAFDNNMSILLIHHTRKMYSEDVFDNILGSVALMGVADATLIFERMRKQDLVKLHTTGRDVEEQSIAMKFDKEKAYFSFEGNAELLELSELQKEVLEMLKKEALSFSEIKKRLNKNDSTVHYTLQKLLEQDLIMSYNQTNRTIYVAKK